MSRYIPIDERPHICSPYEVGTKILGHEYKKFLWVFGEYLAFIHYECVCGKKNKYRYISDI